MPRVRAALLAPLLPSVVHYLADGQVDVGFDAQAKQAIDPRNVIASVKRFMGRGIKDIAHRESLPYDFEDAPGMVRLRTAAGVKSPVEVSAEILRTLRISYNRARQAAITTELTEIVSGAAALQG